jgi:hypothetical protein
MMIHVAELFKMKGMSSVSNEMAVLPCKVRSVVASAVQHRLAQCIDLAGKGDGRDKKGTSLQLCQVSQASEKRNYIDPNDEGCCESFSQLTTGRLKEL